MSKKLISGQVRVLEQIAKSLLYALLWYFVDTTQRKDAHKSKKGPPTASSTLEVFHTPTAFTTARKYQNASHFFFSPTCAERLTKEQNLSHQTGVWVLRA
ncbi:hypothetical protein ATANTOWER_008110 [Ataeniobius toweri]|uniref:Secreted protein n=1 Tax=Ataeniobius toweri TaxID=208326 RepID=A0ABU7B9U6_9TELE|nr:hypothetical protein [Ataeniobius toweri]